MKTKVALIIGFAFAMYGYAVFGKQWFDLCTQVFSITTLGIILESNAHKKDLALNRILIVMIVTVLYAICKQILGVGTVYIESDYLMWVLVPSVIVFIIIIGLITHFKNNATK